MKIDLEPWELEIAFQIGMRRDHANAAKADAAHYDPRRMEDNLRASVASAVCELAVAKATCCYWTMSVWDSSVHYKYRELPDILPNIEVRRIRDSDNPLVVRRRETGKNRIIVTAYPLPVWFKTVDIKGWLPADTAWELGDPAPYDKDNTRLVDQSALNWIEELTAEVLVA